MEKICGVICMPGLAGGELCHWRANVDVGYRWAQTFAFSLLYILDAVSASTPLSSVLEPGWIGRYENCDRDLSSITTYPSRIGSLLTEHFFEILPRPWDD
jgi:hypothetical protein